VIATGLKLCAMALCSLQQRATPRAQPCRLPGVSVVPRYTITAITTRFGMARAASAPAAASADVAAATTAWLALDTDAASRSTVEALLRDAQLEQLNEMMCQRLEFGAYWHQTVPV
jgi:hypothetical protein